jgi:hypothetical protein
MPKFTCEKYRSLCTSAPARHDQVRRRLGRGVEGEGEGAARARREYGVGEVAKSRRGLPQAARR